MLPRREKTPEKKTSDCCNFFNIILKINPQLQFIRQNIHRLNTQYGLYQICNTKNPTQESASMVSTGVETLMTIS